MGQEGQIAGVLGKEGDGREPDRAGAVGARRARWLTREEIAGYRRARWQFLWVVRQEGDGKEPDRAGAVGARLARWLEREGRAGCRRTRWQLLLQWGGRRVVEGRSSRWDSQ